MTSPPTPFAPLPRSTPEQHGVPSAALTAFLDQLAVAGIELHSLMLLRHGDVLAEGWWAPYTPDGVHLLYSLSKSFTSTAVGLAVAEGRLSVDDTVASFFPQVDPQTLHPRVQGMQVRHLLAMASGHHEDTLEVLAAGTDPVSTFLSLVPEEEPGGWFTYNNGATLLLSLIVTAVTGERLLEYLRPRLLDPLGIGEAYWSGTGSFDQGFSGLHLSTEAIARFGQLYLQGGVWAGRQLVPAEWVAEATRTQVDNPREPHPDWRQGYGYQFWRSQHDGYRGDGAYGQFCLVLPDHEIVLATTAATEDMQGVLDAVWTRLLPALDADPTPAPGNSLLTRLAQLSLPVVAGAAAADPTVGSPPWSATVAPEAQPAISSLRVSEAAAGPGWTLHVSDAGHDYDVPCGHGQWEHGRYEFDDHLLATAACGGWTGPTTFTAEIAFTHTPHRLSVVADFADAQVQTSWRTAPLGRALGSDLAVPVRR